jgi:DNA (cytosine-5)-methyltransferase 1
MRYTCIDGFSGAGGLRLGLQRAGFDIVLSFDKDPRSIETQKNNPEFFSEPGVLGDVSDFLGGEALRLTNLKKGELFLLAGGPPCQGFSVQRIGDNTDERNNLVHRFVDLVEELNPHWFLMENVPGIQGVRGKSLLNGILDRCKALGYWLHYRVIDAQDYGVPQRRRRFFLIGERNDKGLSSFSFPEALDLNGNKPTVRKIIGHLPEPPEDGTDHPLYPYHRRDKLSETNKRRLMALLPGQGREHLPEDLLADCHKTDASLIGHRGVYGRMNWDEVAPTITAKFDSFSRGRFGHPEQVRTISLLEGALLQTFPLNFRFAGTKVEIARQIGNAVPPKLAEILGRRIIECSK